MKVKNRKATGGKDESTMKKTYKIEVDCASGSSNGLITVSKIVYEN